MILLIEPFNHLIGNKSLESRYQQRGDCFNKVIINIFEKSRKTITCDKSDPCGWPNKLTCW